MRLLKTEWGVLRSKSLKHLKTCCCFFTHEMYDSVIIVKDSIWTE